MPAAPITFVALGHTYRTDPDGSLWRAVAGGSKDRDDDTVAWEEVLEEKELRLLKAELVQFGVQVALHELLGALGFDAMAKAVLTETDPVTLRHYAGVVLKQSPATKRAQLVRAFRSLGVIR